MVLTVQAAGNSNSTRFVSEPPHAQKVLEGLSGPGLARAPSSLPSVPSEGRDLLIFVNCLYESVTSVSPLLRGPASRNESPHPARAGDPVPAAVPGSRGQLEMD